ncbi:Uncharacterized protein HZ326_10908 [Fusarium oxysporum f. sp. albedinis]|nr:Uncharacterized protein HZ326_10908 [Fusarium oxysporum f. sp. albedinis]
MKRLNGAIDLVRWRWRWLRFVSFLASQVFCVLGSSTWLLPDSGGAAYCLKIVLYGYPSSDSDESQTLPLR